MSSQEHNLTILGQLFKFVPAKLIEKLKSKYHIQTRFFSATSHVVSMIFAQLSHALSLNDVCDCLRFHAGYLSQIRDCVPPSRNGLSHANATRDAGMAEELFWSTFDSVRQKYPEFIRSSREYPGLPHRFKRAIHVVDSTTIQLVAKCMDWAKYRERKAAAKMHMDIDLKSFLPNFTLIGPARESDPRMAWELCAPIKSGEIVVFDRAYVDFGHLHALDERGVTWVTRYREGILYDIVGQQLSEEEMQQARNMKEKGIFVGQQPIVLSDRRIRLSTDETSKKYPGELRMVVAVVQVNGKPAEMSFLTNNFSWSPYSVCDLYRARWGIEAFFKEIKQTLQLADFMGTGENAIRWQIWTALLTYLLLRLVEWIGGWKQSFRRLFTLIKGMLWSRRNILELLRLVDTNDGEKPPPVKMTAVQLQFDFGDGC